MLCCQKDVYHLLIIIEPKTLTNSHTSLAVSHAIWVFDWFGSKKTNFQSEMTKIYDYRQI